MYSLVIWWERKNRKNCVSKTVACSPSLDSILAVYKLYDPSVYDKEITWQP